MKANLPSIMSYVKDRVVFVTGGGGSIGSEICRQIARYQPKKLVIIDNYENNTYEIQMELKRTHPELDLKVLIVSVQNHLRIHNIFEDYKPDIVFHAAAHKHVPLMEDSPHDAIKNNVFGTFNIAKEAGMSGVKRMVLISTDKAVRPTNIMGASKRICEMVIQYMNSLYDTEYVAVRFGNVLGSTEVSFRCSRSRLPMVSGNSYTSRNHPILYDDPRSRQSGVRSRSLRRRRGNIYP